MTNPEPLLEVCNIDFTYPAYVREPVQLFSGLSFSLQRGEFLVILGPPEAGKTTLSRILTGLVPRYTGGELSGTVVYAGRPLEEIPPLEFLRTAGLVFQDPHEQLITSRCDTEVAFPLESLGLAPRELEERIEAALAFFELGEYARTDTAFLSGGEKKKLLLAVQYALDPQVWLLDETLEELDGSTRRRLLGFLRERERSVLLFSSRLEQSYRELGARFALLREGALLQSDAADAREGGELYEEARRAGLVPGRLPEGAAELTSSAPQSADARRELEGNGTPLLQVERLRFSYPGDGFSLRVEGLELRRGETVTLAGANGCGKSTLGRLLCGLAEPAEGRITFFEPARTEGRGGPAGEQPEHISAAEDRMRRVAYMFQNPDYQIFLPTVEAELAYGLREAGVDTREIERRTAEAIERFTLPAADTPPTLLSYGARKRLQAATYYLLDRELYILDEADSGLSFADIVTIVESLRARGAALLLITHDPFLATHFSTRIIRMARGAIAETVSAEEGL